MPPIADHRLLPFLKQSNHHQGTYKLSVVDVIKESCADSLIPGFCCGIELWLCTSPRTTCDAPDRRSVGCMLCWQHHNLPLQNDL